MLTLEAEAANELPERECQRFNNPALSVIAIGEGDAPSLLIDAGDAPVAQRDPVRVVGEVAQCLLWAAERTFGIERPAFGVEEAEPLPLRCRRCRKVSGQAQRLRIQKPAQSVQELSPEQGGQGAHREEELTLFGRAPVLAVAA